MTKLELIKEFLAKDSPIAIVGVSRNRKKFGRQVYDRLSDFNFQLFAINPHIDYIEKDLCFESIESLPTQIAKILIVTPKEKTDEAMVQAVKKGAKIIWVQQMCETEQTKKIAEENNVQLIMNECIFMFAEPKGIHKVHWLFKRVFGTLPN